MSTRDPINPWPKPIFSQSSLSVAAGRLWASAERTPRRVDPCWVVDGALAYAFDYFEDVRRLHRLPLASKLQDILPYLTQESERLIEDPDNPGRVRFINRLLDYANEHAEEHAAIVLAALKAKDALT